MTKKKEILLALFVFFCLLMVLYSDYLVLGKHTEDEFLDGNIDIRQADIGFRVFGKLKTMLVEEGDLVASGDLLAELDPVPYENSLKEAKWRLESVENNLSYVTAQLKRRDQLVKEKSVSEEDFQKAYYNQKALASGREEALAAYENAKIKLEDTRLTAPSTGVIFKRVREPGTVLNPGETVYVLSVSSPVWARAYVSDSQFGKIHPGMQVEIYTDTESSSVYKGHIGFISPIAEFTPNNVETPDLRKDLVYRLRVVVDNPDKDLKQGMPITIKLLPEVDHKK